MILLLCPGQTPTSASYRPFCDLRVYAHMEHYSPFGRLYTVSLLRKRIFLWLTPALCRSWPFLFELSL